MAELATLSVVVVTYNSRPLLERCLAALPAAADGFERDVVVVDNASTDGSAAAAGRTGARVIANARNRGFAVAANQGLAATGGELVLLLNPDVVLPPGSVGRLAARLRARGAAAVGPRTVDLDGRPNVSSYYLPRPDLAQLVLCYSRLLGRSGLARARRRRCGAAALGEAEALVPQIPGACLLTRREVLDRVGLLDERFPIWFEDVDWCARVDQSGGTLLYVGTETVVHAAGASFAGWQSPAKEAMFYRSLLLYFRKHAPLSWPLAWAVVVIDRVVRIVITRRPDHRAVLRWLLARRVPLPG